MFVGLLAKIPDLKRVILQLEVLFLPHVLHSWTGLFDQREFHINFRALKRVTGCGGESELMNRAKK